MPKFNQPSIAEQERYRKIASDMLRDDGRPKMSTVASRLMGRIIRWNDAKHFGFISMEDGEDVYVHESALSESLCKAEEKVGFLVQFDLVARETFDQVASLESGNQYRTSARSVQLLVEPDLIGRLTWKGTFGFIKCAEGSEYFCTEGNFLKEGLSLDTGAVVQFFGATGHTDKRRRAWRVSPSIRVLPSEEVATARIDVEQTAKACRIQTALDGSIVKMDVDRDFGFIVPKAEGADIYFKISEQEGRLHVGAEVLFSLQESGGYRSAFDVTVIGQVKSKLRSAPKNKPSQYRQSSGWIGLESKPALDRQSYEMTGLVTSWSEEKGYGFITPDSDDGVVFAHSGDVGHLKRGTRVTFTAIETLKGKKAIYVSSGRHVRTICRNPACHGDHFVDKCPLIKVVKQPSDKDDAVSEVSTAASTVPCPSRRVLPKSRQPMP